MKAFLKNYRQSPRKVRLIADLVSGLPVDEALAQLSFAEKRATTPLAKLIRSAVANAKNLNPNLEENDLLVKGVRIDKGIVLKRIRPRARGSASQILKRTSHIYVQLEEKTKDQTKTASKKEVATAK